MRKIALCLAVLCGIVAALPAGAIPIDGIDDYGGYADDLPRAESDSSACTITVQKGDTLWDLAAMHSGDPLQWEEWARLNGVHVRHTSDPNLTYADIFPGQKLDVPSCGDTASASDDEMDVSTLDSSGARLDDDDMPPPSFGGYSDHRRTGFPPIFIILWIWFILFILGANRRR